MANTQPFKAEQPIDPNNPYQSVKS